MPEQFYRLAQYEIIRQGTGEIRRRADSGFASVKSGMCFIEGEVLFIGRSEAKESGSLKNELLDYLKQFSQWDKIKYYCPNFTLYACKGNTAPDAANPKTHVKTETYPGQEVSAVMPASKSMRSTFSPKERIDQMKGIEQEALRRSKRLAGR